ncbi:MAG: NAD(P)-dependent oxidoreductase [Gammaproteobacteria bacterium]
MKIGMIGLGAMGAGMALNFHKAGYLHSVWNRTAARAEMISDITGVPPAAFPASLARDCDLIVICVARDSDVLEIIEMIAAGIRAESIVVDTSTVSSNTAKHAAAMLAKKGAHFLDGPVSGGVEGAKNGTLAMMVGGEEAILDRVRQPLAAMAKNIVYIGPCGSGQACKAVNQIMAAGLNQAVTEALAFGTAMGLDMEKVVDVVSSGAAGNWLLQHRGKSMLAGSYEPGFKISLHHKDLEICREMARTADAAALPLVEMTLDHYRELMDEGYGDEDVSALFRLKLRQHNLTE